MLYPLKFNPVYKDYIWGGRNLEMYGRELPDGVVAESWEISCHPDGVSIISNGKFEGMSLPDFMKKFGSKAIGTVVFKKYPVFPLLIKLIDANDRLSVQVHPGDDYARIHENGGYGKNEMWYIISAKPGAKLIYDVIPGVTRKMFESSLKSNTIDSCLKYVEVFPGDVINIPAGLVHAIGEGILLAEIQQNSNSTYRVYDFDRIDKNGKRRPLHIDKALDVTDFQTSKRKEKYKGLKMKIGPDSYKTFLVANRYFSVELYKINGRIDEHTDGERFFTYLSIGGEGEIHYGTDYLRVKSGDSVLIPASLGNYSLRGNFTVLRSYVPDIFQNVISPLKNVGYTNEEIYENVGGLNEDNCKYRRSIYGDERRT